MPMRRRRQRKMIGQMLVEKGLISAQQLDEALDAQKQTTERIGQVLVDLGHIEVGPLYETLSEQMNVPYVDLSANPPESRSSCGPWGWYHSCRDGRAG